MESRASVDDLDLGIVRELVVGNEPRARPDRVTLEAIATRLRVHPNTVAARMRRLEEEKLFLPLSLEAMPPLGIAYVTIFFPLAPRDVTPALRDALFAIRSLSVLAEYVEGALVLLFAPDRATLERDADEATRVLAPALPERESSSWEDWPRVARFPLKRHDVDILAHLVRDPRTSLRRIAAELGVTARTVELRFEAMRKAEAIAMMLGGATTPEGIVMGHFLAEVPPGARQKRTFRALAALCPNYFYRSAMAARFAVVVHARSTAALLDQAARFRAIPGIARAKTRILARWTVNPRFAGHLPRAIEEAREKDSNASGNRGPP